MESCWRRGRMSVFLGVDVCVWGEGVENEGGEDVLKYMNRERGRAGMDDR